MTVRDAFFRSRGSREEAAVEKDVDGGGHVAAVRADADVEIERCRPAPGRQIGCAEVGRPDRFARGIGDGHCEAELV